MEQLYLTELEIVGVRHLSGINIPISKDKMKHLIFTGRNGSGKTSVLEALTDYLEDVKLRTWLEKSEERKEQKKNMPGMIFDFLNQEVVTNTWKDDQINRLMQYAGLLGVMRCGIKGCFNHKSEDWEEVFGGKRYVIAYYGADRVFKSDSPKHIEKVALKESYSATESPRQEFIKYLLDLKMTEALAKSSGNFSRANEIQNWFFKFETLLQQIFEDPNLKLEFDIESYQFEIHETGHKPFGFNTLSSGYAAVLDIVVDLIMRMEKYSESKFQFLMPGIVLIDEIETHLHLELQRNILALLTTIFPNIQFIVSTHSPFILNSLENTVIYDLEKHILVENGLADVPYDGIVEGYFNADGMSQLLKGKFEKYKELVNKANLTDDDFEEVARLELFLDEIPDYLALGIATEYQRLKLEFQNREDV